MALKNINKLFLLGTTLIILSCGPLDPNNQIDEGKVEDDTYTSKDIGWTIQIPKGWTIIEKEKTQLNNEKGKKAIEETIGSEVDVSELKNLIGFQKNQFNIFQSTSELFELTYEGEYEASNEDLKKILFATYTEKGINVDTSSSHAIIDGLAFDVFHTILYGPKGNILLHQEMYSSYINGFDFAVNMSYNNEKDKKIMMNAWKNSKFNKQ